MTEERDQKHTFQYLSQNTARLIFSALLCCALWGSAFPCVKIGYELLAIADTGSQILFAGYRFFLAGVLTFLLGSLMERRLLRIRRSSLPAVIGQGLLQTTGQYVCFYIALAHMSGSKGSVINASNAFFTIFFAHFYHISLSIRSIRQNEKSYQGHYTLWAARDSIIFQKQN